MSGAFDTGYTPPGFDQLHLPVPYTLSNFQGSIQGAQTELWVCQQCRSVVTDPWMHDVWHDQMDGKDIDDE